MNRNYYYFHLNQKMSVLSQKLQQASKLFQNHNFKKSLEAYQDCIDFCHKTDETQSIIFNILSTKATLQYILGDYDIALTTLNSVLKRDANHFLCLLRRSQVYKKKNKLKKALKDLQNIYVFCPDNLQISAFKVEIEHLLIKHQKEQDLTSESEQQQEQQQEVSLNFMKLKLIDRKSIDNSQMKQRKSRVTILGDTTFQYKQQEDLQNTKDLQDINQKAIRTYKQIQLDDQQNEDSFIPIINIKAPKAKKSILKNKGCSIFIAGDDEITRRSRYLGRESKLLNLIKNIDGKIIHSSQLEHSSNPQIKEVQFRKSINSEQNQNQETSTFQQNKSSISAKEKRKSCLKRPSFEIPNLNTAKLRRSKFQLIDESKIDGHVLAHHKKRQSIDVNSPNKEDAPKQDTQSDNQSSQHNIFGSKRLVLSSNLKQQLGLSQAQNLDESQELSKSVGGLKSKKSILKKNSSILVISKRISQQQQKIPVASPFSSLKSKKSVMFNCTL